MKTTTSNSLNGNIMNSILYHMPDWKYYEFNPIQQKDFISNYFPNKLNLYNKYRYDKERLYLFIYLWMYMNGGIY